MNTSTMLMPADALARLRKRWPRLRAEGLLDTGNGPERIPLFPPTQEQADLRWEHFGRWIAAWQACTDVETRQVAWSRLGNQSLPSHWMFDDATAVADALGEGRRWQQARHALQGFRACWPDEAALHQRLATGFFDTLADTPEADMQRIQRVLQWLHRNPRSGLYPRQIPVAGIDSKWLQGHRRMLGEALSALGAEPAVRFEQRAGLRTAPETVRFRLLDPALSARLGGLSDVVVPVEEFQRLQLPVRQVLMVENLQTGLACGPLPGTLLLMAKGYAVEFARSTPWLHDLPVHYWGDIDTHGFVILHRLRACLPHARSLLMDEATLLSCPADRRGTEPRMHRATRLANLTAQEQSLYSRMRQGVHGPAVRLEQERIDWNHAWAQVQQQLSA